MANGKIDLQQIVAQGPTARMQAQEVVRAFNSASTKKVSEPKGKKDLQRLAQEMSGLPAGGLSGVLKKMGEKLSDFVGPVQLSSDNMKDMQTVDASGEGATKQRNLALELANMKAGIEGTPETRALDIGRVATSPIEKATLPAEPGGEMGLLEKVMSGLSAAGKGFADVGNQLIKTPEGRQVLFQLGQLVGGEKITPFGPSQSQLQKRALSGLLAGESPKTAFSPALTPENQQSALASAQRQEALNIQQGNLDLQKRKLDASLNAPTGINPADWDDILQHLTGEFFSAAREQMPENIRTIAGFKEALGGPEGRLSSAKIRDILTPEQQDAWNQATVIGEAIIRETGSKSAAMTAMTKFVRESLGGGQGAGGDQIKGTSQAASSGGRNIIQIQEGPNAASQIDAVSDKDEFRYKGKVYVKRNNRYFPVGE